MAASQPRDAPSEPRAPIPIAPGTNPAAPPGMVAVPAAALSGRQQNEMQQAGTHMGVMGGMIDGGSGSIATGAAAGGYIGQQLGRMERTAAMHDPAAPMVFVDENSRAGRRAIRRRARRQGRYGGGASPGEPVGEKRQRLGWLKRLFGGKKNTCEDSDGSDSNVPVSEAK